GWTKEKFGGFNHLFYEKVFELILRLKGNYLWPAMWGNAFYDDDTLNIKSADEYSVVIGTSHHEPLMRAHVEWQRYGTGPWNYDKGMRVPDDVTLLLCDDNWGNIRRLPSRKEKPRKGGYGIYYHFDYVGDPRNYKWINTNNIARVWEQMHLAWEYNARQIWIVN